MTPSLKTLGLLTIACFALLGAQTQAANTYTWIGTSGGSWGVNTNWTPASGTWPATGDTAVISNTAGGIQNVIYDAVPLNQTTNAAGSISSLQLAQGDSGTNQLTLLRSLTVNNGITLGGAKNGVVMLVVDGATSGTTNASVTGTLTETISLNSTVTLKNNGILALTVSGSDPGKFNSYLSGVNGSVIVNGGMLIQYNAVNQTVAEAAQCVVGGSLVMTSGTVLIGGTPAVYSATPSAWAPRLAVNGAVNISGGAISAAKGTMVLNYNGTNSITNVSSSSRLNEVMLSGSNQTFVCDSSFTNSYLNTLTCRAWGEVTKTVGAPTSTGTLVIGNLGYGQQASLATITVKLSSNVSATASTTSIMNLSWGVTGTGICGMVLDLNGHNFIGTSTSSAANINLGQPSTTSTVAWSIQNSGAATGTVAASWYNFTANQVNVGTNSTGGIVMVATGAGVTNYLGSATSGAISANTVFAYVGNGAANVNSPRAIGCLAVGDGTSASTLGIVTNNLTVQGDVTVNSNAMLNLLDKTLTETGGAAGIGGLNGSGSVYNNGGSAATALLILNTTNGNGKFSGTIGDHTSGSGSLAITLMGSGTQYFTGTNTYSGATTIGAGSTLALGDGANDGAISDSSTIINQGALYFNTARTQNYGGIVTGDGYLVMNGAGTQILSGANSYNGPTFITAGTLQLGAGGAMGSLATFSDIYVYMNATLAFNRSDTVTQGVDFSNNISGAGGLTQAGSGKLILGGNNTYTGATVVAAGEMEIDGSLADASAVSVLAGGTLSGGGTANGAVSVQGGAIKGNNLTLGDVTFNGQSSISGTTNVNSMTVNTGTTTARGTTTSTGNISVKAGATLTNIGILNGNANVSGLLNGGGTINGALIIQGNGQLASGNSPMTTTVSGSLTVENGGKISMLINGDTTPGTDYDQIVIKDASSLVSLSAGSILDLTLSNFSMMGQTIVIIRNESDQLMVGTFSTVTIGGNTFSVSGSNAFTYNGVQYMLLYNVNGDNVGSIDNDLELTVLVPEPGTWAMLVGGLGVLFGAQRMRRRSE